ncbi:MAG: general secretion pathway protein GspF [Pseudomonadota bacterium]|nr:MAG: general secretion pathway protein GspF [Pseudomonadota bacterium]
MARKSNKVHPDNAPFFHENHKKPTTRREFLAQGFIAGNAMIMGPSILGGFLGRSSEAFAQAVDCGMAAGAGGNSLPYIGHDLAGGASIAGSNVLVGALDGQFSNMSVDVISRDGWRRLGLPPAFIPTEAGANVDFIGGAGASTTLAFHLDSPLLQGIRTTASAGTLASVDGTIFCARSDNDTGNNPHNPIYGIAMAGAMGSLATLVGTRDSDSGGRSRAPDSMMDPALRPTKVSRDRDARGLADGGRLLEILDNNSNAQMMVLQSIENLSTQKLQMLNEGALIDQLVTCGYQQGAQTLTSFTPDGVSPLADAQLVNIFANQNLDVTDGDFQKTAATMKLVVDGFAGAGTVEQGGYDYHNGTRTTGEARDLRAGQRIGACLEYAALRNKPMVIYLFSDGSVFSDGQADGGANGKYAWRGDRSTTAATVMLAYNPSGRPNVLKHQIGHYKENGSLDTRATAISSNVDALAEAIVLNYLALNGRSAEFEQLFPNHLLGSNWQDFIAFAPMA